MGIGILVISELFTNYDNNRAVSLRKIKLSPTFLPV
ncbi:DEHA2B07348p [Debaryomyces hansenii CBS767]|uniref:DEHA2B07348p n=1 Tax=Debaryomyces hansenii (strain ATCC 36239 / CBS 767 / BCRC 21394 / JCM 1990 / NBRC 0083 / IGC 2968) TaxID=284592 RepID=Q6BWZ1_DEBHA|nr:DEHA2B07348p [Debaryomyces hansenii CBS767]CAG85279.1 DEHA2B07348p [Debaryomyces hansenii CBS767]|eukprot:XP_457278.1 DEHA2B07348p [Debaryomyces hansenii CBS767]